MSVEQSFLDKDFVVIDSDARIRNAGNLLDFATYAAGDQIPMGAKVGDFKIIPKGSKVKVQEIRVVAAGSKSHIIFARTFLNDTTQKEFGWTSTQNFDGKFVNETLGVLPAGQKTDDKGPNAAWAGGKYLGQINLIQIVDRTFEVEHIAENTVKPFFAMVDAASAVNVPVLINSGFRSYAGQEDLFNAHKRDPARNALAAKPGFSKHQSGVAFDIHVAGGKGNPTYDWLTSHATSFGFLRTVSGEPWHWEYDPKRAATARKSKTFKLSSVNP